MPYVSQNQTFHGLIFKNLFLRAQKSALSIKLLYFFSLTTFCMTDFIKVRLQELKFYLVRKKKHIGTEYWREDLCSAVVTFL